MNLSLVIGFAVIVALWITHFVLWVNSKMRFTIGTTEWLKVNAEKNGALVALKFYFGDNFGWVVSLFKIVIGRLTRAVAAIWRCAKPAIAKNAEKIQLSLSIAWLKIRKARAEKKARAKKFESVIPKSRRLKRNPKKQFVPVPFEEPKTELLVLESAPTSGNSDVSFADEAQERIDAIFAEDPPARDSSLSEKPEAITDDEVRDLLGADQSALAAEFPQPEKIATLDDEMPPAQTIDQTNEPYDTQLVDRYLSDVTAFGILAEHELALEKILIPLDLFITLHGGADCLAEIIPADGSWRENTRLWWESVFQAHFGMPFEEIRDESLALPLPVDEKPADAISEHFESSLRDDQVAEEPATITDDVSETTAAANLPPAATETGKPSELETRLAAAATKVTGKADKANVTVLIKKVNRSGESQILPNTEGENMKFWEDILNVLNLKTRLKGRSKKVREAHDELIIETLKLQAAETRNDVHITDRLNVNAREEVLKAQRDLLPLEHEVSTGWLLHYAELDAGKKALEEGQPIEQIKLKLKSPKLALVFPESDETESLPAAARKQLA
ncbi:MAG: hypothetical protein PHV97_03200 [Candidatus Omnitrophica bacterium]|nr:hypothetical protein [Candidatus Omnitrophota bacterium]